jgi:hypothetical protein
MPTPPCLQFARTPKPMCGEGSETTFVIKTRERQRKDAGH